MVRIYIESRCRYLLLLTEPHNINCSVPVYCKDFFSQFFFLVRIVAKNIIYAIWKSDLRHLRIFLPFFCINWFKSKRSVAFNYCVFLDSYLALLYYVQKSLLFIYSVSHLFFCWTKSYSSSRMDWQKYVYQSSERLNALITVVSVRIYSHADVWCVCIVRYARLCKIHNTEHSRVYFHKISTFLRPTYLYSKYKNTNKTLRIEFSE